MNTITDDAISQNTVHSIPFHAFVDVAERKEGRGKRRGEKRRGEKRRGGEKREEGETSKERKVKVGRVR